MERKSVFFVWPNMTRKPGQRQGIGARQQCMYMYEAPTNLRQINARNVSWKVHSVHYNTVAGNTSLHSFV